MASKPPISCSMAVGSTLSASEDVCRGIMSRLEDCGFSREDLFAVHLALQEAFINAVRHGNKMDLNRQVKIEYSIDSDKIEITVADEGDGFDPQAVPDPRCGENLYKPGGRGLLLMCSYMDVVEHNQQGNSVCMVRHRERPPLTEDLRRKQA
ncbi:MAG: ATP-binding protein [Planctomycetes bacterium]|nr:ATP-binding protein [Planctomycetota bacterium]